MQLSRISRKYGHVTVDAKLYDGSVATVTGVSVALLPVGAVPTGDTVWTTATYTNGEAVVLIAGPDADPTGAIVAPSTRDLWARVTDSPEVDAVKVGRVDVR